MTLELPCGLVENGLKPKACAEAELVEEVGYSSRAPMQLLGCLEPDSGRLENKLWAYFAPSVEKVDDWQPEPGVERVTMSKDEFLAAIVGGEFDIAFHIAAVGLAQLQNKI